MLPEPGQFKEILLSIVDNGVEKPRSPIVKMLLVRLRRLLGLKVAIQLSFAEYNIKRNPVERVHAVHTKELEKHGPFQFPNLHVDIVEHKKKMEEMREDVEDELKHAKFGGEYSNILKGLAQIWNVDTTITGSYSDDYDKINNNYSSCHRTAWTDKYTAVLFDEQSFA